MTVVGLWGVGFCDRFEVEEYFLIFSTRRASGAWPMLPLPLASTTRRPLDLSPRGEPSLWGESGEGSSLEHTPAGRLVVPGTSR